MGHAFSAALSHECARETGGKFLLRVEDLDEGRARPEFIDGIYEDLNWLGLRWGEPVVVQSERTSAYAGALDVLREKGLVYACFCTRADIALALTAPHGSAATSYPGTCRELPDDPQRRAATPHCWRLDAGRALDLVGVPSWRETDGRGFAAARSDIDDAILARKDAPASYHLACVVDDAASGVTTVMRGVDLRSSTPIQRLLQRLLNLPEPIYLHHPLVTHEDGRRLAKRDLAPTLQTMREAGCDGPQLTANLIAGKLPLGFAFRDA